jgi:hypothetical protein
VGYRGHDDWSDMSDYVVHFTKPIPEEQVRPPAEPKEKGRRSLSELFNGLRHLREQDRTGYFPWREIIGGQELRAGTKPLGIARWVQEVKPLHRVVCFSEIPLDMLDRLHTRRSLYGLGFRKDFIISKGGAPLWYLDKESAQASIWYAHIRERQAAGLTPDDPFWKLTPFVDNPGNYKGTDRRFEWEREWRVVGDMSFEIDDVEFLFLPEDEHEAARQFFADAQAENTGPASFCPYIDPRWDMEKIQQALKDVPEAPPPSAAANPWWDDPF